MGSNAVGIDIGTGTITVAEVKQGRGGAQVTNFGGVELPPDALREGEILDEQVVADALKELLASAKVSTKKVWLGVANQRVVVRQIDLPWTEEKELRESLRYQVQEHIPIPVEEAELDVHVVEDFVTEDGERMRRVLLVAGQRDMITSYVDVAEKAGLKPIGIDLDPFAVLRAMGTTSQMEPGQEVLVDVGAGVTNIIVHDAGMPTFVRILVMGGDDITNAIASGLSTSYADAEAVKRGLRIGSQADVATDIATQQADQFIEEIRNSLDYYQTQTGGARISTVVLTGGGATLAGLPERMASVLRMPVEVGSPFGRWKVKNTVYGDEDLARVGPSLATAVGLALGGLA